MEALVSDLGVFTRDKLQLLRQLKKLLCVMAAIQMQ
jgi:hypothetical protein